MLEKERCWHNADVVFILIGVALLGGGGEATTRCFIVALVDDTVEADERTRVEECRDDAREARAPIFLHAVEANMVYYLGLCKFVRHFSAVHFGAPGIDGAKFQIPV